MQKLIPISVRMGKTYQSEQYMISKRLESKVKFPEIVDSTYRKIYSELKSLEALDTVNNNLFLLKKTTNDSSIELGNPFSKLDLNKIVASFLLTHIFVVIDLLKNEIESMLIKQERIKLTDLLKKNKLRLKNFCKCSLSSTYIKSLMRRKKYQQLS